MKVHLISTGGTIASTGESGQGATPTLDGMDLADAVPEVVGIDRVFTETFSTVASNQMTVEQMWHLTERIREGLEDADAVVVTHGTDTLEETAHFVDLCYDGDAPVVFTGAMRPHSRPSPDGPMNLEASLRVATSEQARGSGVLVTISDKVYAARDVTKVHSTAVDAFASPEFGPLATVDPDGITWRHRPIERETYTPNPAALTNDVMAVTVTVDHPSKYLKAGHDSEAICLGTLGAGHVPPSLIPVIEDLRAVDIPIVVTTRCPEGRLARNMYDFPGSEQILREMGCHFADRPLQKIRITTIIALAANRLNDAFEQPSR